MSDPILILYVDDEPLSLEIGRRYLEKGGDFKVIPLLSASDALRVLQIGTCDVIVSDYQMQEMDGITFLKEVRGRNPTIPFILFTGRGREDVVIEAFENGADFYLQKCGEPKFQFIELIHKIHLAVERRRTEKELRESEERYRSVVEDQSEYICQSLPDGTYVFVNEAFCRNLQVRREEIIGKKFRLPIHEDDRERVYKAFASLTVQHPSVTIEQRMVAPDGSIVWQQWVDRAIFDDLGRCISYQSVGRDITTQKLGEEQLTEKNKELSHALEVAAERERLLAASEERFRTFFNQTAVGFAITAPDGAWIHFNDRLAGMLGYTPDELRQKTWADLTPPNELKEELVIYEAALRGKKDHSDIEKRYVCRNGSLIQVLVSTQQVRNPDDSVAYLASIIQDITTRKQAESALKEAEERFRILFRQSPIPYQSLDAEGRFLDVNDAWLYTLGYEYDEVISRWFGDFLVPEQQDLFRKRFPVFKEIGEVHGVEFLMKLKDGGTILISFDGKIGKNPDGSFRQTHCVFREITRERETEISLMDREERLNLAILGADLGTWDWDIPSGRITINERWATMLGYSPNEIIPHFSTWESLVHPDDLPGVLQLLQDHLEGKTTYYESRFRLKRKAGGWTWVLDKGKIITRDENGRPTRAVGTHLDITGIQLAREQLREMNQYHRGLIEASIDSFVTISEDGKITDVNIATEELTGCNRVDLIGKDFSDYFTDPEKARAGSRIAFMEGKVKDYPLEIRHVNGTNTPVLYNASVYLNKEEKVAGIFAVARDVTGIRMTEAALKASEAFLNAVLDSIQDIIGIQNTDHRIIMYNRAGYQSLQKPFEEVTGKRCYKLFGRTGPCDNCATNKALISKQIEQTERYVPELGTWLDCRSNPVLNESGDVEFVVEQLIDVTERKQVEEAIREANQKLRLLTGLMRHDILNQLSVLQIFHDLALKATDSSVIHSQILHAQEAGERIEKIIGFTREYENFGTISSGWDRIKALIRSACQEANPGGVQLIEEINPQLEVYADPIIRKVFTTLIENAARHGEKISTIKAFDRREGESLIIVFEDDGVGVADGEKNLIFEHGYGKHTGIGLFLAREILAITGLSIRETGKSGNGARFEIIVPEGKYRSSCPDKTRAG